MAAPVSKVRAWFAAVLLAAGTSGMVAPCAGAGSGEIADLSVALDDRLAALEARVEHLDAVRRGGDRLLAEAEARRALSDAVLADADTRLAMLDDDPTAGWDDGFFVTDPDGHFRLELSGQIQLRWVGNFRRGSREDGTRTGFENRRTKLKFEVEIGEIETSFNLAFDRVGGTGRIEGPYIQFPVAERTTLRIGRFRTPLLREYTISSKRQLFAERSLVARRFRQPRQFGIGIRYQLPRFRVRAGFMDAGDTLFIEEGFLVSARAEYLFTGRWGGLRDFTSFPDDEPVVAVAVAALLQYDEPLDRLGADRQLVRWTADFTVETGGANAFVSFLGNHVDEEGEPSEDQYGLVVQGGMFLTNELEMFAQYVWGSADRTNVGDLSVVTVGLNRYLRGHGLKGTLDVGYGINEVPGFWSSSGAGWQRDQRGEDGQIVVRAQAQLLF